MVEVIPLFGRQAAEQLITTSSAVPAPEPAPALAGVPTPAAETEKVSLHDGDLVVYRRPDGGSKWQYRLRLPNGDYERKTTGKRDVEDAKRVAEARYQEVRWREQKGYSAKVAPFDGAAESYIAQLLRAADQAPAPRRMKRIKKAEWLSSYVRKHLVPHFLDTPLDRIDARAVERFHEAYVEQWQAAKATTHTVQRTRDNRGRVYKKPITVTMPGTQIRKPGVGSRILFERLIRGIFERAIKDGSITRAEMPEHEATAFVRNRRGSFTREEQELLMRHLESRIKKTKMSHHRASRRLLWLWARFNCLAGLRPGEETGSIRFKDVLLVDGETPHYVVKVNRGKTGSRSVVVDEQLGDVMEAIKEQHPDPKPDACLWIKPNGEKTVRFAASFTAVLKELGLDHDEATGLKRTAYSLRHYAITDAIQRGVNLSILADNVGNSVQQISSHYDHVIHTQHAAELLKGTKRRRG